MRAMKSSNINYNFKSSRSSEKSREAFMKFYIHSYNAIVVLPSDLKFEKVGIHCSMYEGLL